MSIVALDVGDKTIGVAASDDLGVTAQGVGTVWRKGDKHDFPALLERVKDREITRWIVGFPLNMDGTEGPRAQSCRAFARNLERLRPVNIAFWDERLSTSAVERFLIEDLDLNRKRRAQVVDRTAAAWILQGALDRVRDQATWV